jgi:hypothetical protein
MKFAIIESQIKCKNIIILNGSQNLLTPLPLFLRVKETGSLQFVVGPQALGIINN